MKNVVFTKSPVCKVPNKIERIEVPLSSVPLMDLQPLKHALDIFYLEVARLDNSSQEASRLVSHTRGHAHDILKRCHGRFCLKRSIKYFELELELLWKYLIILNVAKVCMSQLLFLTFLQVLEHWNRHSQNKYTHIINLQLLSL